MNLFQDIEITMDDHTVTLHPSLECASKLERLHNGFQNLAVRIADGHISTIFKVIEIAATVKVEADNLLKHAYRQPLYKVQQYITYPLFDFCKIVALAGSIDDSSSSQSASIENKITHREYHSQLYEIATGWLGWTPKNAWQATPNEILTAYKPFLKRLKVTHGLDLEQPDNADPFEEIPLEQIRDGLAELRGIA